MTNTEGVDVKCVIGIDGKDDAFVLLVVVVLLLLVVVFDCDGSVLDFLDFRRNGFQLLDFLDFLEVDVVDVVEDVDEDVAVEDVLLFFVSPSLSVVVLLLLLSLPNNFYPNLIQWPIIHYHHSYYCCGCWWCCRCPTLDLILLHQLNFGLALLWVNSNELIVERFFL